MKDFNKIIDEIEKEIVNPKARATLLVDDSDFHHPTPFLHTRDSILKLAVQLLKTVEKYDNGEFEYEGDNKYVFANDVEDTFFCSVSDQRIQGLSIFKNYEDLISTLIDLKKSQGDMEAVNSLRHDPDLSIENLE